MSAGVSLHGCRRRPTRPPADKPTIGLLLWKSKNNVVAEYALHNSTMPIGIAEWTTAITTDLTDDLTSDLPRLEDIEAELE